MKRTYKLFSLVAALMLPLLTQAQNFDYQCSFENDYDTAEWTIVNSSTNSKWYIGTAAAATGTKSLYISSNGGTSNDYTVNVSSVSYAYQTFWFESGSYYISYNWRCLGEDGWDYLRVFLAPASTTLQADVLPDGSTSTSNFATAVPTGWICLNGDHQLGLESTWQLHSEEFSISQSDSMMLILMWCNDGSSGSNPAGAFDNIHLAENPCPAPDSLTISNLDTSSFTLSWHERGSAYQWYLELDTLGAMQGSQYVDATNDTSYTFSGLYPNSTYTVYLAADCNGDTGRWVSINVTTACVGVNMLPFVEDFENVPTGSTTNTNFINCWEHVNNTSAAFGYPYVTSTYSTPGGSKSLYWYSYGTTGPYKGVVLPIIDSAAYPIDTLQLTFWVRPTSTSYRPVFVVGILPNIYDMNSFVPVETITVNTGSTDWSQVVVPFSSYQGPHGRIAVLAPLSASTWYAYTDEFVVDLLPPCPDVTDLTAQSIGTTSAYLSWSTLGGSTHNPDHYIVEFDTIGVAGYAHTVNAPASPFMLTGLTPGMEHKIRVRAYCENDSLGGWDSITVITRPLPCEVSDPSTTYTTTLTSYGTSSTSSTSYILPASNFYKYTYTQQLVLAEELNGPTTLTGIDFQYNYTVASTSKTNCTIYLCNTTTSSLTSGFIPYTRSDFVAVYTGPLNCHQGWNHFNFSVPFAYTGGNLLIAVLDNSGSYNGSSYTYNTHQAVSGIARYLQNDSSPYNLSSLTSTGSSLSYRSNMKLYALGCLQSDTCAAPNVQVTRVELDTVSIVWSAGNQETSWEINYQAEGESTWTVVTGLTDTRYDFTTLQPQTSYTVRVIPVCGDSSRYAEVDFTVPCVPVTTLPFTEDFENFTATSSPGSPITECWTRLTNYSSSAYPYRSSTYAHSGLQSMYFYSNSSTHAALVLPKMGMAIDSLQVSFAAYKTSANYQLMVGIMTDPDNINTFVPIDTISPAATDNWEMFEIPFDGYTGNGHYIAFLSAGSTTNYMYLDDVTVSYIPECPRPRNVSLRNVTTSTATAQWSGTASEYIVEYGPYGFNHGEGMTDITVDDSIILYGLYQSSSYQVYVRGICGPGDTSDWSFVTQFASACDDIDTLPFREDFTTWGTGNSARPACWVCGGYSTYPNIANYTTPSNRTYRTLNMYAYSANRVYASMPGLDSLSLPITSTQVIITAVGYNLSSYSRTLIVGVCDRPGDLTTFVAADTLHFGSEPSTEEVSFDGINSTGRYITFVSTPDVGTSYSRVHLINVQIESIPPCQRPNRLHVAGLTATSADIQWNDRSNSTAWQVEYGPRGFAIGTGTRQTTFANPYTISGLTPSTDYDVYVRSVCTATDTSTWQIAPLQFSTMQQPAQVPYFYDFESEGEWHNWQTNSNVVTNWYRDTVAGSGAMDGTGRYSIYISADSGASVSSDLTRVVNATAYRDFDFGSDPFHTYQFSFRAVSGGTPGTSGYDGLILLHVDPTRPVEASDLNIHSPWGFPGSDTCDQLYYVRCNGYWNTYSAILDTLTGVHRFAFYWFNQGVTGFVGDPAAVDDVTITSFDCPRPAGVKVSNVTISTADISWVGPDTATYSVRVRNQHGTPFSIDTVVHTNRIHVAGMSNNTKYSVMVRRKCSDDDSSILSPSYTFTTLICNNGHSDTIVNGSPSTSYYMPFASTWSYSYSQQIIPALELGGPGEISALNLNFTGTSSVASRTCTIYMSHTSLSSFGSDFVNPDSMTMVYSGNLNITSNGWYRIVFNTPFIYNGTDNLLIAFDDNYGHGDGTTYQHFAVNQTTDARAICAYSSSDIVPSSTFLNSYSGNKNVYNYCNQMIVETCPYNTCPSPLLRNPIIRSTGATLRWRNTSDRYAVAYRLSTTTSWVTEIDNYTDTFYTTRRLQPNTDYVYRVRQYCDSTGVSNWTYGTFNSGDIPCLPPEDLHVTNLTNRKVSLAWTPAENNVAYRLHVFNSAFDKTVNCYIARATVNNLEAGMTYYAAVQAECDGFDAPGEFCDTIVFTTPICPDPSNLVVLEVYGNSAVIDWTPGGDEELWEVMYGDYGFTSERGITVMTDHHPFTIPDLWGSTDYQVYVRSYCASDWPSERWAGPAEFTTLYSAINSATDDARVKLQPNPTSGDVTITLPNCGSEARIEVLDVTGRVCMTTTLSGLEGEYRLATSQLSPGTYFIRVTADEVNTVKKLVIR